VEPAKLIEDPGNLNDGARKDRNERARRDGRNFKGARDQRVMLQVRMWVKEDEASSPRKQHAAAAASDESRCEDEEANAMSYRAIHQTASKICEDLNFESLLLKTKQEASSRIQRAVRVYCSRKICSRRKSAAILGSHVKTWLLMSDWTVRRGAAHCLLAGVKRFFRERSFRAIQLERESSVIVIRERIIARVMQDRYQRLQCRQQLAIQKLRGRLRCNKCRRIYQEILAYRRRAGEILQAAALRLSAQRDFPYLKMDMRSGESFSSKINNILTGLSACEDKLYSMRWRAGEGATSVKEGCVIIQRVWRGHRTRMKIRRCFQTLAAIRVQRVYRGHAARARLRKALGL